MTDYSLFKFSLTLNDLDGLQHLIDQVSSICRGMALTLVVEKLGGKIHIRCDATEVAVHGGEWLELRTALLCLEDYVAEASRCHVGSPDTRAADSFWIGTDTQIAKAKLQERRNKIAALLEQT